MKIIVDNITCNVEGNEILNDCSFEIDEGDCIALLGPNGHGKSTLLNVLMGNPHYKVTQGKVTFDDKDLLALSTDERSKLGMFMAFQNPPDVPGVVTMDFYRAMINAHQDKPISLLNFYKVITTSYKQVNLDEDMANRHLNEGYSGGEKKRNEILQMLLLKPKVVFLDEIDSGLDVDALTLIANTINELRKQGTTFVIISHYDRLYQMVDINKTAVIVNGKIALNGDASLAKRIASEGYSFLEKEYKIKIAKVEKKVAALEVCGVKKVI